MEFVEKVTTPNPVVYTEDSIDEIAKMIRAQEINNPYNDYSNYFFFTVSPLGKEIFPNKKLSGHPQITEFRILPEDPILKFILDHCVSKNFNGEESNNIIWSVLAVLYGYIHISGWGVIEDNYKCTYNPFALNFLTKKIPDSINFNKKAIFHTFTDPKKSSEEQIEYSVLIPFLKRELENRCKNRGVSLDQIYETFKSENLEEYVRGLNDRFKILFQNLLGVLGFDSLGDIIDNEIDIYKELSKNEKISKIIDISPIDIIDYLENYGERDEDGNKYIED